MNGLARILRDAIRRQHRSVATIAYAAGIREPRVRAFIEDGAAGPIRPTPEELMELSRVLTLSQAAVLEASRSDLQQAGARRRVRSEAAAA
ncbi:XRE family transcriptional regulator [Streptomyces sp. NPDC002787]